MLRIQNAILHAFDFESGSNCFSQREMDLSRKATKSYVQRHMRKIASSAESKHGEFSDDSGFANALKEHLRGQVTFVELSQQMAQFFWEELRRCDDLEECDLLVCRFNDTLDGKDAAKAIEAAEAQAQSLGEDPFDEDSDPTDLTKSYFACVLLPRKQAFVHDLAADETGAAANDILRLGATLPNPSQKCDSYVLVDLDDFSIDFHDKVREVGSVERMVIPDGLLQCTTRASSREVVEKVEKIVEEVAEEYGISPVEAVAHAKSYVQSNADREESFCPEEVGKQVFADRPEVQEHYERVAREEQLPEEVPVKRGVANRLAKNHKIKTDTGIEVTFPSEYAADANYIEFTTDNEGYVSIIIKNVGRIENK